MKTEVTLIAPCYNAERFIARFLDSVLDQTYKEFCFILVNDGSTDGTDKIIESYRQRLEESLAGFIYLKQENNGAASAVDHALKFVDSTYLAWADVDDVMSPDNLELKKEYLDTHPKAGLVLCGANAVDENTNEIISPLVIKTEDRESNIFDRLIFRGIPCYPGVFMVRKKLLFDRLKNGEIYWDKEVGQNWQLLLPVAYDNVCGYIEECLYDYYVRMDSHSHNTDHDREIGRTYAQERVLKQILDFVPTEERAELFARIEKKYILKRLELSCKNGRFENYGKYYAEFRTIRDKVGSDKRLRYRCMGNVFLRIPYKFIEKLKRKRKSL